MVPLSPSVKNKSGGAVLKNIVVSVVNNQNAPFLLNQSRLPAFRNHPHRQRPQPQPQHKTKSSFGIGKACQSSHYETKTIVDLSADAYVVLSENDVVISIF